LASIIKPKKTHYKNYSNPNAIHKNFDDQTGKREKNTSFHSKLDINVSKHEMSTNLISNTYLPHVKTKQTILEYELFKKQRKSIIHFLLFYKYFLGENANINVLYDKKQLHYVVKQKNLENNNGKSEKRLQNKSVLLENKENLHDKINEAIKIQNNPKIEQRPFKSSNKLTKKISSHYNLRT